MNRWMDTLTDDDEKERESLLGRLAYRQTDR